MTTKTPNEVTEAIKKLDTSDQVAIQTYIAKLKANIAELEADGHAHYHGHEKCTGSHDHDHDHAATEETAQDHEGDWSGHDHEDHEHEKVDSHEHGHEHAQDDIPEWKKKAMAQGSDPTAAPFGGSWNVETSMDATASKPPPLPPLYDGENEDFEKASNLKMEAADLKAAQNYSAALEKYNEAILAAPPSALLYANRADVLFRLKQHDNAIRDCDEAIKLNPDSAKALRIRGRCKKILGDWEQARKDLSASQAIDFDDVAAEDLKFVQDKVREKEQKKVQERLKEEERKKKRMDEIKKAKEQAEKEKASRSASAPPGGMGSAARSTSAPPGGIPGMGSIPGMGGMAGMAGIMQALMSDPELAAGLKNPKVMAAFADLMKSPGGAMGLMSNPAKFQELMADPDVGPFMKKIVEKLGPMMMGGGAAGGMPNANSGMPNVPDMDMPDVPDMSNDDMPNLE